jgi:hypothetical protein
MRQLAGQRIALLGVTDWILHLLWRREQRGCPTARNPLYFATWRLWVGVLPRTPSWNLLRSCRLLLELLVKHAFLVDAIVDLQADTKEISGDLPHFLSRHADYVCSLDAIKTYIAEIRCTSRSKELAVQFFHSKTREMLAGLQRETMLKAPVRIDDILDAKRATTGQCGEFCFRPIALILDVKGGDVDRFIGSLAPWLMALQIADDIADFVWDIRAQRNTILTAILRDQQDEWAAAYASVQGLLPSRSLAFGRLAPLTGKRLYSLAQEYLDEVRHYWDGAETGEALVFLANKAIAIANKPWGSRLLSKVIRRQDHLLLDQ